MTRRSRAPTSGIVILLIALLGIAPAVVADETPRAPENKEAKQPKEKKEPVIFIPKSRGRAKTRSGGGTRGAVTLPSISVIAPEHEGFTTLAQPTLFWFVSGPTDARVDFTLIDEESEDPLIEVTLNAPIQRGIHALRLADFGLSLERDTPYVWFVSLIPDPLRRSKDVVAGSALQRVEAPKELESVVSSGVPAFQVYAENGFWYDCINALERAIESAPSDTALREQQVAFFNQVGLEHAAAFVAE